MAAAPQALLPCEQLCNNAETTAGSVNIPTEPDNTLPHYLVDNLPDCRFDAAVNCKLGDTAIFSAEQYCEAIDKPTKVLIDTRILTPHVFEKVMMAYLSEKTKHPDKQAVIITNNGVTSGHKTMQTFQHCYTVGLRTKRCKIWHDPPAVLTDATALSSIFKGSLAGANAKIMLDTGSAANCISEQFCKGMKIKVSPLPSRVQPNSNSQWAK